MAELELDNVRAGYGETVVLEDLRLTIAPVLLGHGLRLFGGASAEQSWDLKDIVPYRNGFVELSYRRPSAKTRRSAAPRPRRRS